MAVKDYMRTYDIALKRQKDTLPVDFKALPDHIKANVIEYGLTKGLNDRASNDKNPPRAFFEETVARWMRGVWQKTRTHETLSPLVEAARFFLHQKGIPRKERLKVAKDADVTRVLKAHGFGDADVARVKAIAENV